MVSCTNITFACLNKSYDLCETHLSKKMVVIHALVCITIVAIDSHFSMKFQQNCLPKKI
jgi:hypothetical protein